jgi:hypothetical protein
LDPDILLGLEQTDALFLELALELGRNEHEFEDLNWVSDFFNDFSQSLESRLPV